MVLKEAAIGAKMGTRQAGIGVGTRPGSNWEAAVAVWQGLGTDGLLIGQFVERCRKCPLLDRTSITVQEEKGHIVAPALSHVTLLFLNHCCNFTSDGNTVLFFHLALVIAQKPVTRSVLGQAVP